MIHGNTIRLNEYTSDVNDKFTKRIYCAQTKLLPYGLSRYYWLNTFSPLRTIKFHSSSEHHRLYNNFPITLIES